MTKISRQKLKHLENEKSFWSEIKSIFHDFQRDLLSVAKNCLRPETEPLILCCRAVRKIISGLSVDKIIIISFRIIFNTIEFSFRKKPLLAEFEIRKESVTILYERLHINKKRHLKNVVSIYNTLFRRN